MITLVGVGSVVVEIMGKAIVVDHSVRGGHRDDSDSRDLVWYGDRDVIKMPESSGAAPSWTAPGFSYGRQREQAGSRIPFPSHSARASHPTPCGPSPPGMK